MTLPCFSQRGTDRRGRASPNGERFPFGPSVGGAWVLNHGHLLLRVGYRMPEATVKVRETSYQVKGMPIPEPTLAQWSHQRSAKASKQAHVSIRKALVAHNRPSEVCYEVFLQGSYKNGTNLRRDSDVDVVVRLDHNLKPSVAALSGDQLQESASHEAAYRHWQSFRRHALRVMRDRYEDAATSGRKTLKLAKGELQADADLVITLSCKKGIGFYLPDERRWVVSYPQQHHERGLIKEEATSRRFKRTIRMFKAARNQLVSRRVLTKEDAPSYFIECLLYNVPDGLFAPKLAPTYSGILTWLKTAKLRTSGARTVRCACSADSGNSGPWRKRGRSSRQCGRCGERGVEHESRCRPGLIPWRGCLAHEDVLTPNDSGQENPA